MCMYSTVYISYIVYRVVRFVCTYTTEHTELASTFFVSPDLTLKCYLLPLACVWYTHVRSLAHIHKWQRNYQYIHSIFKRIAWILVASICLVVLLCVWLRSHTVDYCPLLTFCMPLIEERTFLLTSGANLWSECCLPVFGLDLWQNNGGERHKRNGKRKVKRAPTASALAYRYTEPPTATMHSHILPLAFLAFSLPHRPLAGPAMCACLYVCVCMQLRYFGHFFNKKKTIVCVGIYLNTICVVIYIQNWNEWMNEWNLNEAVSRRVYDRSIDNAQHSYDVWKGLQRLQSICSFYILSESMRLMRTTFR